MSTVQKIIFGGYFYLSLFSVRKSLHMRPQKYRYEFINGQTLLVCWYPYRQNQLLNGRVCFNIDETSS